METIKNFPKIDKKNFPLIDKKDFPLLENNSKSQNTIIYLDHAATTQKPIQVLEKIDEYYKNFNANVHSCLLYTSPSPRDATLSRMPSSA